MAVWVLPVADLDPRAWRAVYLVPLLAVPPLVAIGRRLPESRRFTANATPPSGAPGGPDDPGSPGPDDRRQVEGRRLLLLAAAAFLLLVFAAQRASRAAAHWAGSSTLRFSSQPSRTKNDRSSALSGGGDVGTAAAAFPVIATVASK